MVSAGPIIEGTAVGFGTFLILLAICGLLLRRRLKTRAQRITDGYEKIGSHDCAVIEESKRIPETKLVLAQPSVTWAEPLTQPERKPRSASCPDGRMLNTLPEDLRTVVSGPERKLETTGRTKRKRTLRRRATTDGCYHVCQVQFSILYNFYNSKLFLKVVCAVNIPSTIGVTYGSFVKLELLPSSEKAATDIQFHTNNPVFDESMEFPGITYDELLLKSLKIRLFSMDRFSHSSLIGEVVTPFTELEINPVKPTTVWRPIFQNSDQSNASSSKEIFDRGELYLSLRYQVLNNKVTVVVMKATNLPKVNKIFAVDPYVIVKLQLNLKTVQAKKTTTKRRTTSPSWNEPFVFEIDDKIPISEYSFCFKVMSHNNLSEDPTLGEVEIGYHTDGLGPEHWKDMIVRKNQNRAMCHKLK